MSFLKPAAPTIAPPIVPEAIPPVMNPQGTKPAPKRQQTSFLGAASVPQQQSGGSTGKTLLGQ